jgi:hypothetical protein
MPADPREAGRKGGLSKSAAKIAAAKRNGFQKVNTELARAAAQALQQIMGVQKVEDNARP